MFTELSEPPEEEISHKLWVLAKMGMDRTTLVDSIKLLGSLSWSTVSTEQGHSAGSKVLKQHQVWHDNARSKRSVAGAIIVRRPPRGHPIGTG